MSRHADPEQWIADRLSEIIPPLTLAYSCLLKTADHSMLISDLRDEMLRFPEVEDAREIHLTPPEAKTMGIDADKCILRSSLSNFVDFSINDFKNALNRSPAFIIDGDRVMLSRVQEPDIGKTLFVLRTMFAEESEDEIRERASQGFVAYFHYHNLDPQQIDIPERCDPSTWLTFSTRPDPETALMCLFLSRETNVISLSEYLELQFSVQAQLGDSGRCYIGALIGDLVLVVLKSHFFTMTDRQIIMLPVFIFPEKMFVFDDEFMYKKGESRFRIQHGLMDNNAEPVKTIVPEIPRPTIGLFDKSLEAFRRLVSQSNLEFTKVDVLEYVSSVYSHGDFMAPFPLNQMPNLQREVNRWIEENAIVETGAGVANRREMLEMTMQRLSEFPKPEPEKRERLNQIMTEIAMSHREVLNCQSVSYPLMTAINELSDGKVYRLK